MRKQVVIQDKKDVGEAANVIVLDTSGGVYREDSKKLKRVWSKPTPVEKTEEADATFPSARTTGLDWYRYIRADAQGEVRKKVSVSCLRKIFQAQVACALRQIDDYTVSRTLA